MESSAETKKTAGTNKILIGVIVVLVAVVVGFAVFMLNREDSDQKIGYSADAKVMMTEEEIAAAMKEAQENAENSRVSLSYKNDALSQDGRTFACYLANSERNKYDAYFGIYADANMSEELYLSDLVPPGSGFEEITLESKLATGDHTVYVALTQVDTADDGTQTIVNQVFYTMEFHVT